MMLYSKILFVKETNYAQTMDCAHFVQLCGRSPLIMHKMMHA